MQLSLADSSVKVGRFCGVSGNNFVPIFRMCWCAWCAGVLVAPKLMTRCPALPCVYVEKYTAQGRTPSHQFWFHQHNSTPAYPEDGVSCRNVANPSYLKAAVCQRQLHWILSPRQFAVVYTKPYSCYYRIFRFSIYLLLSVAQQRRITRQLMYSKLEMKWKFSLLAYCGLLLGICL